MCVIIFKPFGATVREAELRAAFQTNSHGAGYMYRQEGLVCIQKGFMTIDPLLYSLTNNGFLKDGALVPEHELALHFRIATSGGIAPGRTHPFPIHKSYKVQERLVQTTNAALMHNGIITSMGGTDYSDTQEIVSSVFYHVFYNGIELNDFKAGIDEGCSASLYSSKFLLFTPTLTYWLGRFETEDRVMYSNLNHRTSNAREVTVAVANVPVRTYNNPHHVRKHQRQGSPKRPVGNHQSNPRNRVYDILKRVNQLHNLPHVKLIDQCFEADNCIKCPYFRFRKKRGICRVFDRFTPLARKDLPHILKTLQSLTIGGI